ncbi:MAG: hypothetical protein IJW26_03080 [Clostridia bacterium]|nr:hypothetical protein [Clostridia bacterium]
MKKLLSIIMLLAVIVLPINLGGCTIDNFTVELDEDFYFYESEEQNNNNIVVNCNDNNVICKYTCELGRFINDENKSCREIIVQPNQQVAWWRHMQGNAFYSVSNDYVTITLLKGGNAVGYAVIKMEGENNITFEREYKTTILKQEVFSFPKKETEVQNMARQIIKNDSKNNFVELMHWFHTSGVMNNAISIAFQDKDIYCKYLCDNGVLMYSSNNHQNNVIGKEVETGVMECVFWPAWKSAEDFGLVDDDYISILLLKDNMVVGYAVIEINRRDIDVYWQVAILKQEMLDVPILETEALQLIENIKNKEGDNC